MLTNITATKLGKSTSKGMFENSNKRRNAKKESESTNANEAQHC